MGITGPITPAQRAQLGRVRASSQHLLGLIEEILDLSKIEAGRFRVERVAAPVVETVDAAVALVTPQAAEKGLHLALECDPGADAWFMGDPDRVRQILVNLLSNAVKFTDAAAGPASTATSSTGRGTTRGWRGWGRGCASRWKTRGWGSPPTRWRRSSSPSCRPTWGARARTAEPGWGLPSAGSWPA
jgi:light-regulated signal transduction histidine kinase (bacteriophytochrome)